MNFSSIGVMIFCAGFMAPRLKDAIIATLILAAPIFLVFSTFLVPSIPFIIFYGFPAGPLADVLASALLQMFGWMCCGLLGFILGRFPRLLTEREV